MATLYPDGYGRKRVTLAELEAKHGPLMEPEFRLRLFAWIESMGGLVGIGGGFRTTQPDLPGFAEDGKSFHQFQEWASGITAYAAVDLVVHRGWLRKHRAPTWAETDTAGVYGLHTFITNEPWHIQVIEIRGWQSWVWAGRPDPKFFALPGTPPPSGDDDMASEVLKAEGQPGAFERITVLVWCRTASDRDHAVQRSGRPMRTVSANELRVAGPVVGELPPGYDANGIKL